MGGLDHVVGADDVLLKRLARLVHAFKQPQRREVKGAVLAVHVAAQQLDVFDGAVDDLHPSRFSRAPARLALLPRTKLSSTVTSAAPPAMS